MITKTLVVVLNTFTVNAVAFHFNNNHGTIRFNQLQIVTVVVILLSGAVASQNSTVTVWFTVADEFIAYSHTSWYVAVFVGQVWTSVQAVAVAAIFIHFQSVEDERINLSVTLLAIVLYVKVYKKERIVNSHSHAAPVTKAVQSLLVKLVQIQFQLQRDINTHVSHAAVVMLALEGRIKEVAL